MSETADDFEALPLFTTPLFVFHLTDVAALNDVLGDRLLQERHTTAGIRRSNVGGWHYVPDLAVRKDSAFQQLIGKVVESSRQATVRMAHIQGIREVPPLGMSVESWAMVMENGDYTILHDHCASTWSSAYYVDAGDADLDTHPDSGRISFIDPRRGRTMVNGVDLFPSTFNVSPETGDLLIFPGFLQHYVHPYKGSRPRISISSNLTIRPQQPS